MHFTQALALRGSRRFAHLDALVVPRIHAVVEVTAPISRMRHQSRIVLGASVPLILPGTALSEVVTGVRSTRPVPTRLADRGMLVILVHHVSAMVNRLVRAREGHTLTLGDATFKFHNL